METAHGDRDMETLRDMHTDTQTHRDGKAQKDTVREAQSNTYNSAKEKESHKSTGTRTNEKTKTQVGHGAFLRQRDA